MKPRTLRTARSLVDAFYFSHADWPTGTPFVVGHILLTLVFVILAVGYASLLIWHVWLNSM